MPRYAVLVCFLFALAGCEGKKTAPPPPPPPPTVGVSSPRVGDAPYVLAGVGQVDSPAEAAIKPQVTGIIQRVLIAEGAEATEGQVLFQIDPAPYEAKLKEAQAALQRDLAKAELADREFKRYLELVKKNVVSADDFEKYKSQADQAKESVRLDEALLATAKLNLEYTKVRAPFSGRAGFLKTKLGNVVTANGDVLVEIKQVRPIHVRFVLSESDLDKVLDRFGKTEMSVEAIFPDEPGRSERGTLIAVDNRVDRLTGTFALMARFDNESGRLWPGRFIQSRLTLQVDKNALLIPKNALVENDRGKFVFAAAENGTALLKPIVVVREVGEELFVSQGVDAKDRLVVEGKLKLIPGRPLAVKGEEPVKKP